MNNLLMFLPDEAFPLLLVLLVIAVVAGLARFRLLLGLLLFLLLLPVIGELFGVFLAAVPLWLVLLVAGGVAMWTVRAALSVLLGRDAVGPVIGMLAAEAIKLFFRLVFVPFRIIGWLFRQRHA